MRLTHGLILLATGILAVPVGAQQEIAIGPPVTRHGLEVTPVYLEAVPQDDYWGGPPPEEADIHLEADILALPGTPGGFAPGTFVPYLTVQYHLEHLDTGAVQTGLLWQMVATDGPHYGVNVHLPGEGRYRLRLLIEPPSSGGLSRHLDEATGVSEWWDPFEAVWEFTYPAAQIAGEGGWAAGLNRAERGVQVALEAARLGEFDRAYREAVEAYLGGYEGLEFQVVARAPELHRRIESRFAEFRWALRAEDAQRVEAVAGGLREDLSAVRSELSGRPHGWTVFGSSLLIILREGTEALLILGLIAAVFRSAGQRRGYRWVMTGAGIGVLASLVTAYLFAAVFRVAGGAQEVLEGGVMLLAAAVLFSVSHWLVARFQTARWKAFVQDQLTEAMGSGRLIGLGAVGFVVVYREGFETVLFYRALLATLEGTEGMALVGLLAGAVGLVGLYLLIVHFGVRLPLRPFFLGTSGFLYLLAFTFIGRGLRVFQQVGLIPETPLAWPRLELIGVYPTAETLAGQGVLLLAVVAGLAFLLRRTERVPARGG